MRAPAPPGAMCTTPPPPPADPESRSRGGPSSAGLVALVSESLAGSRGESGLICSLGPLAAGSSASGKQ